MVHEQHQVLILAKQEHRKLETTSDLKRHLEELGALGLRTRVYLTLVANATLSTALQLISPISVTTSLFETLDLQTTPLQNLHAHPRDL